MSNICSTSAALKESAKAKALMAVLMARAQKNRPQGRIIPPATPLMLHLVGIAVLKEEGAPALLPVLHKLSLVA